MVAAVCPSDNTAAIDQEAFWNNHWDAHKVGWIIAGASAGLATAISLASSYRHARHYHKPREQRQIIRILLMPMVYGIVSFFSYRFFRAYTYYELAVVIYEALVLMAFLALLLAYIGASTDEQMAVMQDKGKRGLPFPFGCIRYRPSKPYFLHALNFSVLQYAFLRPLISIIGIVCQVYNVLCPEEYSAHFAEVYLDAVDFVSISVALYGLIVLYALLKERLAGKKPLAKFLCIKLIVMFTFYQSFVFSALASHGYIKATKFWTKTNVTNGLNSLCTCVEMILFALLMWWAYPVNEYRDMTKQSGERPTSVLRAYASALNFWDFVQDFWAAIVFAVSYARREPGTHSADVARDRAKLENAGQQFDIDAAFKRRRPADRPSDRGQGMAEKPYARYQQNMNSAQGDSSVPMTRGDTTRTWQTGPSSRDSLELEQMPSRQALVGKSQGRSRGRA